MNSELIGVETEQIADVDVLVEKIEALEAQIDEMESGFDLV